MVDWSWWQEFEATGHVSAVRKYRQMSAGAQLALFLFTQGAQLVEQSYPRQSGSSCLKLFLERPLWTHPEVCFNSKPIQVNKEEPPFHTYLQTWIILITESSLLCWPWSASLALSALLYWTVSFLLGSWWILSFLLSVSDVSSSGTCSGPLGNGSRAD